MLTYPGDVDPLAPIYIPYRKSGIYRDVHYVRNFAQKTSGYSLEPRFSRVSKTCFREKNQKLYFFCLKKSFLQPLKSSAYYLDMFT